MTINEHAEDKRAFLGTVACDKSSQLPSLLAQYDKAKIAMLDAETAVEKRQKTVDRLQATVSNITLDTKQADVTRANNALPVEQAKLQIERTAYTQAAYAYKKQTSTLAAFYRVIKGLSFPRKPWSGDSHKQVQYKKLKTAYTRNLAPMVGSSYATKITEAHENQQAIPSI